MSIQSYIPQYEIQNLQVADEDGKALYKSNNSYRSLINCFEHPEFKYIIKTYFGTWNGIKSFVMFLNLYNEISNIHDVELSSYQKLFVLHNILSNRQSRAHVCNIVSESSRNLSEI